MGVLYGIIHDDTVREKIDAINNEAWNIRVVNSNKAHTLSLQALDLANTNCYHKGQGEYSRTLGFTFIRLSQ